MLARIVATEGAPENCMPNKSLNTSSNKLLPCGSFYVLIKHLSQQYSAATEIEDVWSFNQRPVTPDYISESTIDNPLRFTDEADGGFQELGKRIISWK